MIRPTESTRRSEAHLKSQMVRPVLFGVVCAVGAAVVPLPHGGAARGAGIPRASTLMLNKVSDLWRSKPAPTVRQSPWSSPITVEAPAINGGDPWIGARGSDDDLNTACGAPPICPCAW